MESKTESQEQEYDADGRQIIDGSLLEGGGQILRIAAALSCILHIPIRVKNIRAGRDKPGLKAQHMTGLQLVASLCNGKLDKCRLGSLEITLDPGPIQSGQFLADTKTAGSICLLIQVALPCLLYSSDVCTLHLQGGTNCDMAPQIDYLTLVFKPMAEKFGLNFDVDIKRRGYFPKGGGEVILKSQPVKCLVGVEITQPGELFQVYSRSFVAGNLPEHLSKKVSQSISRAIKQNIPAAAVEIKQESMKEVSAIGSGLGTIVLAETTTGCLLAGSALGKPRTPAEEAGTAAVKELMEAIDSKGCVDQYLQDQIILLMALAEGQSKVLSGPLTLHTRTAIHIVQLMTQARFTLTEQENKTVVIACQGLGHLNPYLKG
ncbi:RNA 3'-terminal phosphate cyclase-like isoform X1 [Biomphalaria glabrata]|uniref:RNA 3'-terminal phosphate cyclase n=1 Tax=Biomphalaria glabrata TaxID=6526 RepID=A0A9W3AEP9_BIOGL|nr:RNA 3'-terminal phosphate cyclase-like isoform X1 [Biomphalaria glabrata]XP_055885732.1 RNA 3'-terminal phosphate cyclase-like isoform X1 [Biomphalaria glabrata]XP_055885733.1 RNA 3'-terminal phosphate cyclase-like isoform X1 [Biomphalaria glabrata]XP_055885734.1 RNA 3'-terminal phosphate cyclase-like isoform X1 [Biomphalaria glabrata]